MDKVVYKAPNVPGTHMPDVFIMTEPGMAAKYRAQRSHQGSGGNHIKENDMHEPAIALVDVVQCKSSFLLVHFPSFPLKVISNSFFPTLSTTSLRDLPNCDRKGL